MIRDYDDFFTQTISSELHGEGHCITLDTHLRQYMKEKLDYHVELSFMSTLLCYQSQDENKNKEQIEMRRRGFEILRTLPTC